MFSMFNFILLSSLVGVTCSYELILTAMSSLHVKVNELEFDHVTKKPNWHSVHWTCLKHRQPNQLLRLR